MSPNVSKKPNSWAGGCPSKHTLASGIRDPDDSEAREKSPQTNAFALGDTQDKRLAPDNKNCFQTGVQRAFSTVLVGTSGYSRCTQFLSKIVVSRFAATSRYRRDGIFWGNFEIPIFSLSYDLACKIKERSIAAEG